MFLKKKIHAIFKIKVRKYDKLLVFLYMYKQIDVCCRIMCYAFTECAYYNLLKEKNVFFFRCEFIYGTINDSKTVFASH